MVMHMIHDTGSLLISSAHWVDSLPLISWHLPSDFPVLAQNLKPTDLSKDIGVWWNNFVKTGQLAAFIAGIVFGYMVKTFTSFG
ncbi:hypothetical protein JOY44_15935 [Phormidium sp. CLA17]|uniref:hypothetical protein n=1 Tax=Leptolyngbya sp. Cla-17 TaxID=2803751 RepID=UPI001492DD79|nr:hypothetical protein [Leptolyngbya sp. Cla-17]MBM0743079.1 hypothetical protein [Leptolyngbya sp. Cla-17]